MIMDLCQDKVTGEIHYFLGIVKTSKGLSYITEVPRGDHSVYPRIGNYLKLDFEMKYKMLGYKLND